MEKVCKSLKFDENDNICALNRRKIDDESFKDFCVCGKSESCPAYLYYYQKYRELTRQ